MIEIKRILCGTDFSPPSRRAMEYGRQLAERLEAEIVVLNVVEVEVPIAGPVAAAQTTVLNLTEYHESRRSNAKRQMNALAVPPLSHGLEIRKLVLEGRPSHEITKFAAEEEIDLIVIGTHGHSGWRRLLFGSVAEKVVRSAPCPVLTVGPDGNDQERLSS